MQENEKPDMQAQAAEVTATETKKQKFERERLARRAALKKMGVTTGMAVFAMFSVDDLAHMVGKAMEQRAGDSKIADQIAHEFSEAGIALASGTPSPSACATKNACVGLSTCQCCMQSKLCNQLICEGTYTENIRTGMPQTQALAIENACIATATATASTCCTQNDCNCSS